MGWRGGGRGRGGGWKGPWPGRGPFSHLPPWQRPGWVFGLKMGYSMQPGSSTHGNCTNFEDGLCTLYGVSVDPNGAACPSFTPKSIMEVPKTERVYPGAQQYHQPYSPQTMQGYRPHRPTSPQFRYPPMPDYHSSIPYPPQTGYGYPSPYGYPYQYGPGYRYPYRPPTYPYIGHPYGQFPPAPMPPTTSPPTSMPMAPPLGPGEEGNLEKQRSALEQQINALQEEFKRIERRLRELRG